MTTLPVRIKTQLTNQISGIHARYPRHQRSVAAAVQPMTSMASGLRTRVAAFAMALASCTPAPIDDPFDDTGELIALSGGDGQVRAEKHRLAGTKRAIVRFPWEWGVWSIGSGKPS